jgi:hypothetical protein
LSTPRTQFQGPPPALQIKIRIARYLPMQCF